MRIFFRKTFLILLIFLKIIKSSAFLNNCEITNIVKKIKINKKIFGKRENLGAILKSREFTLNGWFQLSPLLIKNKKSNILNFYNSAFEEESFDYNSPSCIITLFFFNENKNLFGNIPKINNNENCFLRKKKTKIQKLLGINIIQKKDLFFEILVPFSITKNYIEYKVFNIKYNTIKDPTWFYFSYAIDFENSKGNLYLHNYSENEKRINFNIKLKNGFLKNTVYLGINENSEFDINSVDFIRNFSLFHLYLKKPDYFRFVKLPLYNKNPILFQYDYTKEKNDNRKLNNFSKEFSNINFESEINILPKNLFTINQDFIQTLNLFFSFKIKNLYSETEIFSGFDDNQYFSIKIINPIFYSFYVEIKAFVKQKKTEKKIYLKIPLNLNENKIDNLWVSLINQFGNTFKILLGYQKKLYYESDLFYFTFNFPSMKMKFGDSNSEIKYYDFKILKSPFSYIISSQNNSKINFCLKNCKVPLFLSKDNQQCLICENSVLLIETSKCVEYCPKGKKNIAGICRDCVKRNCGEMVKTKIKVFRYNNNSILFALNKNIPILEKKNFKKYFKVKTNKKNPEFTYDLIQLKNKNILLKLKNKKTIYDSKISISILNKDLGILYDSDRNIISKLQKNYKISQIRYLSKKEKKFVYFFAYLLIGIFITIIVLGLLYVFIGLKHNVNEFVGKKLLLLFQDLQLIPFLLLFNISLPSNLHLFLSVIYRYLIGFNQKVSNFVDFPLFSRKKSHPNFYDDQLSSYFIKNFSFIFIFHCSILILFFLVVFSNVFIKYYSYYIKNFLFKSKEILEYNILLIIFFAFSSQIIVFAILNLDYSNMKYFINYFSYIISWIYIFFILFIILMVICYYFSKNFFLCQSALKFKLSFLFIGYRNSKYSNLFEIERQFIYIFLSFALSYYLNDFFNQILIFFIALFVFFFLILLIKPHERDIERKIEIFNVSIFLLIVSLIATIGILENKKNYNTNIRKIIGRLIIVLIFCKIFIYFIIILVQVFFFLKRIFKSRELIFHEIDNKTEHKNIENCSVDYCDNSLTFNEFYQTNKNENYQTLENFKTLENLQNFISIKIDRSESFSGKENQIDEEEEDENQIGSKCSLILINQTFDSKRITLDQYEKELKRF